MRKTYLIIICCLTIIGIGAYELEKSSWFTGLKNTFHSQEVPSSLLNYGAMGKILKELSLVKTVLNKSKHFPATSWKKNKDITDKASVRINLKTDTKTQFQIFWATEGQSYTEKRSSGMWIKPEKTQYELFLPNLINVRKLRIDPAKKPAKIHINSIIIEKGGYKPIRFKNKKRFKEFRTLNGIRNLSYSLGGMSFVVTGEDPQFEVRINLFRDIQSVIFPRKRQVGEYLYEANPKGPHTFPSSTVIKEEYFKINWPLISIVAEESDLYHPDKGIITNKTSRGRQWERPVYVSYFENKKLLFATMAGLRVHGGKRLQLFNSFRLYFRNEYGAYEFKPGILFSPKTEPLKRLVVHHTAWPPGGWYFNNTLSYEIARHIGGIAPETKLAILFINGISKGIYFLTPQLNRRQIRSYFGHDNFRMYRFKNNNPSAQKIFYVSRFWRFANSRKKLKMKEVEKFIDLDNLTRHLFSFVFSGTSDFCQGAAVLDKSNPDAKLFWINWDMDQSFIDVKKTIFRRKTKKKIWEQDAWKLVYRKRHHRCGRTKLFTRLMDEDPAYKKFVIALVMDLLNHRINKRFLNARLQFYDNLLSSSDKKNSLYIEKLDYFFQNRPSFLRKEMQKLFGIGEIVRGEVNGPHNIRYEIDGYPEPNAYTGYYRKGKQIRVKIKNLQQGKFSHWLINDEKVLDYPLTYTLNEKTNIRAVFSNL